MKIKRRRRYSLKQLYYLWIEWVNEKDILCQEFFKKYNLDGSFIVWLEKREKGV